MLTKREIVLIIFLLTLVTGVAYYFLYLTPALADIDRLRLSVENKEQELMEAEIRSIQYGALTERRDEMTIEWESYLAALPEAFDETDAFRIIQRIMYPFVTDLSVALTEGGSDSEATRMYKASLQFTADDSAMMAVLQGFAQEECRILTYNISRTEDADTETAINNISMEIEFLTL